VRVAVLSDVHSNLHALEAVLAAIDADPPDELWCLGDVVGYGPDPNECVDCVRRVASVCVAGNHDWAAIGRLDLAELNDAAAEAAAWTARHLAPGEKSYLESLPLRHESGAYTLAHGSPRDPIWEYVLSDQQAAENFASFSTTACFVGHTHVAIAFSIPPLERPMPWDVQVEAPRYDRAVDLDERRHLVNVGSVGQPRDRDPAARYVILDTERRAYQRRRVEYDVARTQDRIRATGLPDILWLRLAYGR
jgi:diadenosine tetraphosphatase ApaH/serine/threonine PP2A family protein phosphatase